MAGIRIVTDSTADIPDALMRQWAIDMVPLSVSFGSETLRDRIDIDHFTFMDRLTNGSILPTTSQPPPGLFEEHYRRLAAEGAEEIVSLHLSERLSGTVGAARIAAEAVADLAPVTVIDSRSTTLGLGFMALEAARAARAGADRAAITAAVQKMIPTMQIIFFADTLEYLQKGGRIGRAAAILGSIISLKPLMRVDEGVVVPHERTRTRSRAIEGLLRFAADFPHIRQLAILRSGHADATPLLDRLASRVPAGHILVTEVSPVIGVHLGPNALGLAIDTSEGPAPVDLGGAPPAA